MILSMFLGMIYATGMMSTTDHFVEIIVKGKDDVGIHPLMPFAVLLWPLYWTFVLASNTAQLLLPPPADPL